MNDKKNKSNFFKSTKLKKINGYSAYIYLALAICIVSALTIGIFTMSYDFSDISTPQVSIPEVSVPEVSVPEISESPVVDNESNVDNVIDTKPKYYNPIANGSVAKAYSIDALVFSSTMQDYRVHTGIDISAEVGAAVLSYADGTIAEIKEDPFFGKTVVIEHGAGLTTYYKNLALDLPAGITAGAAVKAGDTIGMVGTTAIVEISDPSHLHFEMTIGGEQIDPKPELEANVAPQ